MTTNNETQWKLVPVEPTPEMVEAHFKEVRFYKANCGTAAVPPDRLYRAMLSAAPQPPAQPASGERAEVSNAACAKCGEHVSDISDCNRANCPTMAAFNRWWFASKYMQVVSSSLATRRIALDAWNAALLEADAQPAREWVGLTEKELWLAIDGCANKYEACRVVMSRLREKNAAQRPAMKPLTEGQIKPGFKKWKDSTLLSFESAFEAGVRFVETINGIKEQS